MKETGNEVETLGSEPAVTKSGDFQDRPLVIRTDEKTRNDAEGDKDFKSRNPVTFDPNEGVTKGSAEVFEHASQCGFIGSTTRMCELEFVTTMFLKNLGANSSRQS